MLIVAATAHAQRLNLDTPSAPPPGATESTRTMKASLRDAAIGAVHEEIAAHLLGAAARARTQALALALILRGEELGAAGSQHIVAAMVLLSDMSWPSELGARAAQPDGAGTAAALRAYIRSIDAMPPSAGSLPAEASELDVRLREIFAPLTELVRPEVDPRKAGWVRADSTVADDAPAVVRSRIDGAEGRSLDEPTRIALMELLGLLDDAAATWSFAAAAQSAGVMISGAIGLACGELPAWAPAPRRDTIIERSSAALRAFATSTRDAEAAEALAIAADASRVLAWADALQASASLNARDLLSLRLALVDAAADALDIPGAARDRGRRALRSVVRAVEMVNERGSAGAEADVAQSLRTSFRALDAAAKKSEVQLIARISEIARAESATSQPAIVSAIASHRRALDDLKMLRMVDGLLARHRDDQSPTWRLVSSRLLRVGQDVSKSATMETALLDLRAFAAAMELQEPFGGESAIRAVAAKDAALPAWDAESIATLTGNKAAAVVARIDELRTAYLETWAREGDTRRSGPGGGAPGGQDAESIASRLRVLRMLCAVIEDARAVRALAAPEHRAKRVGLMAWRGLPVSRNAAEYLGGDKGLAGVVSEAAAQALDPSPAAIERARTSIRRLESTKPSLRLVARLDREARDRGIIAVPPYASLAAPPTRGAWMDAEREKLAAIARYLDEAAAATGAGDAKRAGDTMRYVEMLAAEMR